MNNINYEEFNKIRKVVLNCTKCELCSTRKNTVLGVGYIKAEWMFIGEAPGYLEDMLGLPFMGQSGKLLNNIFNSINLKRSNIYITNILKCRPINFAIKDRMPTKQEIISCIPYLYEQISFIKPKIIITLGKVATFSLLKEKFTKSLKEIRGKKYFIDNIPLIATYHPAFLLRKPTSKIEIWRDLCFANDIYNSLK